MSQTLCFHQSMQFSVQQNDVVIFTESSVHCIVVQVIVMFPDNNNMCHAMC
jgi:hypothetical protein